MSFPGLGSAWIAAGSDESAEFYDSECWWSEQSSLIVYNYAGWLLAPADDIIVYSIIVSCQAIYTVDENDK